MLKQQNMQYFKTPQQEFLCNFADPIKHEAMLYVRERQVLCDQTDVNWLVAINLAEKGTFQLQYQWYVKCTQKIMFFIITM